MSLRHFVFLCVIALVAVVAIQAQTPAPAVKAQTSAASQQIDGGTPSYIKEETPEQRKTRLGMAEDPGPNPDPNRVWSRFGHQFKIERFERRFAAFDQPPGLVRPRGDINFAFELYQQNDKYVWVWMPTVEELEAVRPLNNDAPAEKVTKYTPPQIAYLKKIAPEFSELNPPASNKIVRFEDSSNGLPQSGGSWRNSGAIADMNGDGKLDIVVPPTRGPAGAPNIYLGDGKGHWQLWQTEWPYPLQYGNVVAADFNLDGKMDVALGVHLTGVRVFLGDGKGKFTDASEGLNFSFPTRRVAVADVNGDGAPDILAIYEGPTPGMQMAGARVKALINENKAKSWKVVDAVAMQDEVSGDYLATGKFNNDKYPDFVTGNFFFQRPETLYMSEGPAKWKMVDHRDGELVPYLSLYTAVATGRISTPKLDDAVMTYGRTWPVDIDPTIVPLPAQTSIVGLDLISFAGKEPKRTPIIRFGAQRPITGVSAADFDGDGKTDLFFTRFDPREAVLLLGDGKGGFTRATVRGIDLSSNPNYDINVADVNGDGRPDLMVMYESTSDSPFTSPNGSIRVFLNRGPEKVAAK